MKNGGLTINISVIIPVFHEEDRINSTLDSLWNIKAGHDIEVIVVDGDSGGSTLRCISDPEVIRMTAPQGRAMQMNRAAARASGDILLFLHADTTLPENGFEKIKTTMASGQYVAGAFNYAINSRNLLLRHLYYTSYLRSRLSGIAYGDQAIFIRKDYFHTLGGFPEIPVMEDIELMKKIKKNKGKIRILKEGVNTSTRRYEEEGILYGWLRNHFLRFLYHIGVSPAKLKKFYPDVRKKKQNPHGLVLFLKYPQKGKVKTRLAKVMGEEFTLELYEAFLRDLLDKLIPLSYNLQVFVSPPGKTAALRRWLDRDLPVHDQEGDDLGERMKRAFIKIFRLGYEYCILMGSDYPDLPAAVLQEAFEHLTTSPAVIAPAADGGYYLIGFQRSRFCEDVFHDIEWSTGQVFRQTMARFEQKNVTVKVLPQWWDVDEPEDLDALMKRNSNTDFTKSRTMRFLEKHKEKVLSPGKS